MQDGPIEKAGRGYDFFESANEASVQKEGAQCGKFRKGTPRQGANSVKEKEQKKMLRSKVTLESLQKLVGTCRQNHLVNQRGGGELA